MKDKDSVLKYLQQHGIACRTDAAGCDCTTFKIGGPLGILAEPCSNEQLIKTVRAAELYGCGCFIIGNGSNLLIPDEGVDALFIRLAGAFCNVIVSQETGLLSAGAGASLAAVAKASVKHGLMGLEWAAGIPGTVGGAVAMNAGAYGGEIKDVIETVELLKGGRAFIHKVEPEDLAYRYSAFAYPNATVLSAVFRLAPDDGFAEARMRDYNVRRREKQPIELPSAGSTFKRPEGYYAAALIDQAGLKGFSVGGASVSEKHAGFVVNNGGATYADVVKLMDTVRDTVYKKFGVELEPEVKIL